MDKWVLKDGVVCFKSEDAEINGWSLAGLVACLNKRDKTIADLEAKLAEKDAEIENLTKSFAHKNNEDLSTTINGVKFTSEQIIALQQVGYSAEYDRNQTAIAVLEKVKEIVLKEVERVEERYSDGLQSGFNCCYVFMRETIDQQINDLRSK